MHVVLVDSRAIRLFNVLDDFSNDAVAIEMYCSLPSERVTRVPDQLIQWRGRPLVIQCDNGLESITQTMLNWVKDRGMHMTFIQPRNS